VVQSVEEASMSGADRQGLLSEFNRISGMKERKELLKAAFAVASLSGFSAEESRELRTISNFLWIDPRDYNEIRQHYTA
jgi:tellurite resistance protein